MQPTDKIVVIGLDGATLDVMRPLIQRGELPHLASLVRAGVAAELASTYPFVTSTAFGSFMTGVNPGKHGMFDFTYDSHRTYDAGPLVDYMTIRTRTLWELLTELGKKIILVTVPFTYPPPTVNGQVVCSGKHITEGRLSTYPPGLAQEVADAIGGYEAKVTVGPQGELTEEYWDGIISIWDYQVEKTKEAALYLMKTYPWDLIMTVFVITDRSQHYFWEYMDSSHPGHEGRRGSKFRDVIHDAYRKVDEAIGEMLRLAPKEAHVVVMSDHGFGPLHYMFYANRWLLEEGLLRLRGGSGQWEVRNAPLERRLEKIGLSSLKRMLPASIRKIPVPVVGRKSKPLLEMIDWNRTQAYATRWGININLKGREPSGIVEPGRDYDRLVEDVMESLREVKDPKTGHPLFDMVARKEEVYEGPYVEHANDILVSSSRVGTMFLKYPVYPASLRPIAPSDGVSGEHRREGLLVMGGPAIESGATLGWPRIEDVAPTILYLLGSPIPDYMDGQVLVSAIRKEYLRKNRVAFVEGASADRTGQGLAGAAYEEEEEKQIREQLKNLGYMG